MPVLHILLTDRTLNELDQLKIRLHGVTGLPRKQITRDLQVATLISLAAQATDTQLREHFPADRTEP